MLGKAVPLCVVCPALEAQIPPSSTSGLRIMGLLRHKLAMVLIPYLSLRFDCLMLVAIHVRSQWDLICMAIVNTLIFKVSELAWI